MPLVFKDKTGKTVNMSNPNAYIASVFDSNAPKLRANEKTMINNYVRALRQLHRLNDIHDAYARPSEMKQYAWSNIVRAKRALNGTNLLITGFNSCTFSCAFVFEDKGQQYLRYFTHCNTYDIPCTDDMLCRGVA